jgi:hypothetical protein
MPSRPDKSFFSSIPALRALRAGAIISVVAGAYKIGEFLVHAKHLHGVREENNVYVRIIERVRADLAECERLLALPQVRFALSTAPGKVEWIRRSVHAVREALREKANMAGGLGRKSLGLRSRLWWVLDTREKLENLRMEVALSYMGLLQVLAFLAPLEPLACCEGERPGEKYLRRAEELYPEVIEEGHRVRGGSEERVYERDVRVEGGWRGEEEREYGRDARAEEGWREEQDGYGRREYAEEPRERDDFVKEKVTETRVSLTSLVLA